MSWACLVCFRFGRRGAIQYFVCPTVPIISALIHNIPRRVLSAYVQLFGTDPSWGLFKLIKEAQHINPVELEPVESLLLDPPPGHRLVCVHVCVGIGRADAMTYHSNPIPHVTNRKAMLQARLPLMVAAQRRAMEEPCFKEQVEAYPATAFYMGGAWVKGARASKLLLLQHNRPRSHIPPRARTHARSDSRDGAGRHPDLQRRLQFTVAAGDLGRDHPAQDAGRTALCQVRIWMDGGPLRTFRASLSVHVNNPQSTYVTSPCVHVIHLQPGRSRGPESLAGRDEPHLVHERGATVDHHQGPYLSVHG